MEKDIVIKKKLKWPYKVLIIIALLITFILLWARYISTSGLVIKEYKVSSSNLPISFNGLKVVHLSDIHYGGVIYKKELENVIKEVNILKPDIVVFTGDLIDKDIKLTSDIKNTVIEELKKIKSTYGKYAVSGNHDFVFKDYKNIIKDSGFILLDNSYDVIYNKNYDPIFIGGLESAIKGRPDIIKVMSDFDNKKKEEVPSFKLLIMHTPDTFDKVSKYNFDLVLAGHSHNGQVRLPFIGKIVTPLAAKKYYDPYYRINNTDFYISGGIGTSEINFRFFNKPSFNFYRIVKK
jgi:predicted MPP superfamily phosphohydrolase